MTSCMVCNTSQHTASYQTAPVVKKPANPPFAKSNFLVSRNELQFCACSLHPPYTHGSDQNFGQNAQENLHFFEFSSPQSASDIIRPSNQWRCVRFTPRGLGNVTGDGMARVEGELGGG